MADRLRGAARIGRFHAHHHRGGGRALLAAKRARIGHDDMDARRRNAAYRLDGPGDFAFEGTHPRHFLHEGGDTERAEIVEEFVAGIGAVGQPLLGQQHACPRRLGMRHHHGIPRRIDVEGDTRFRQGRADAGDILAFEPGIEHGELRAAEIIGREPDGEEHRQPDQAEYHQPLRAQLLQAHP